MEKQLLIAAAVGTALLTYFLLKKKHDNSGKYLEDRNYINPNNHHLTQAFAKAKKRAMS